MWRSQHSPKRTASVPCLHFSVDGNIYLRRCSHQNSVPFPVLTLTIHQKWKPFLLCKLTTIFLSSPLPLSISQLVSLDLLMTIHSCTAVRVISKSTLDPMQSPVEPPDGFPIAGPSGANGLPPSGAGIRCGDKAQPFGSRFFHGLMRIQSSGPRVAAMTTVLRRQCYGSSGFSLQHVLLHAFLKADPTPWGLVVHP